MDYLYDGTFEGFLTCVYLHYYEEKATGIYAAPAEFGGAAFIGAQPETGYQQRLGVPFRLTETDAEKAAKVYEAIPKKVSDFCLRRCYQIFLTSVPDKDNINLQYLRLAFKLGPGVDSLHSHPVVYAAQRAAGKVSWEVDKLSGLLRFSVLGEQPGILYGPVTPDHDIIALLGEHFADRYKEEAFIIHDLRRGKALFYRPDTKSWAIAPLQKKDLPAYSAEEQQWQRLWKHYFDSIAIKERINPRCQRNFMPVRYWANLTEFSGNPLDR
ncbi:MAG: DNA metabolism protein [Clostridiales bacterium]|nr:DNA metabolism protein [Clostridiales bacterium]